MSYILDALRKSESDRQHAHAAGIADIPSRRSKPGTPQWVWLLGALLVVNAAALLYLTLAPEGATPPPAAIATPVAATATAAPVVNEPGPQPAAAPAAEPESLPPAAEETETRPTEVAAATPPARVEPAAAATQAPDMTEATLMELRASGQIDIPELHLDIHVYSREPADRFVFINMNKYREREQLAEGPRVREIIENGVILEHGRHRFLLPRE